jgi:peptidoglycan-associated lipoprotein
MTWYISRMLRPAALGLAALLAPLSACEKNKSTLEVADDAGGAQGGGLGDAEQGQTCGARDDCAGGLACTDGKCSECKADADCTPVACTLETGRCHAEGQCQTDEQCAHGEACDGGMCIFAGDLGHTAPGPCVPNAVFFALDSDVLTPGTQEALTNAAACFAEHKGEIVYLEAHADDRGSDEYAILLTERRAEAVRAFLHGRGVPAEMMQVIAKGSLEAVGADEPSRAKERRVQFTWPAM